jgi:hypothetical protein
MRFGRAMTRLVSVILALTFVAVTAGSSARPYVEPDLDLQLPPAADSIVAAPFSPVYCYDGENARSSPGSLSRWRAVSGEFCNYAMGQSAAEYSTQTNTESGTQYLTGDHLGSTRLVTDADGNEVRRYDYLPFGEGIPAGANNRPASY